MSSRLVKKSFNAFSFLSALLCVLLCCAKPDPYELVEVKQICPSIIIDMPYATDNNFLGSDVYTENRCFLRRHTAERLARVQNRLQDQDYGLKIWDGYRPLYIQKLMWEIYPDARYVANPEKGSRHNRGTAVDVTLVDSQGKELAMPTAFDDFTEMAGAHLQALPENILKNRAVLQSAMTAEGFLILDSEWWHFDDPIWENCEILDVPIDSLLKK